MQRRSPRRCSKPSSPSTARGCSCRSTRCRSTAAFNVGPFDIELISVAHSIPESNALAIRTPLGTVLHTGDWKLDPTPIIGAADRRGAAARARRRGRAWRMICDSTNALREGRSPSETDVAQVAGEHHRRREAARRGHDLRLQRRAHRAVAEAAAAAGREVVVAGRAMHRIIEVAMRDGLPADGFKYLDQEHFSLSAAATRWCCCAPAARASRAPRWRASPRTSIPTCSSTRATWSSSPRAPSPATRRRSGASRTGSSTGLRGRSPTATRWCTSPAIRAARS